ncbi:hypothetical protein HPHPP1_0201 [Helicobacter pylori Hp P-1]|nr:hypothetical protein HPHPP1_0201 [Helicobacter pylori Hp P-1]EJC22665.1 hypothetical protein HPHPP1B_0225 [Helicobacter pylori Hp P-1b]
MLFLCLGWFCVLERCHYSLILVARVFKFFNTAFWVIVWLVFSFYEKNSQNN